MVFFFFNLIINSPKRPCWCHSSVFIGSSDHALRIAYCWLWRPNCICLEQNSIGKSPKDFKASGSPCCILNNTQFFWNRSGKSKKFHDVRKSGNVSKENGICRRYLFMMRYLLWSYLLWLYMLSSRTIACVVDKQSGLCKWYLLLKGLYVPSVKTTTCVCNRFNTSFWAKDHKTNQAISNLNRMFRTTLTWVGFLGLRFYPLASMRLRVRKPYFHLNSHTYLASCI